MLPTRPGELYRRQNSHPVIASAIHQSTLRRVWCNQQRIIGIMFCSVLHQGRPINLMLS